MLFSIFLYVALNASFSRISISKYKPSTNRPSPLKSQTSILSNQSCSLIGERYFAPCRYSSTNIFISKLTKSQFNVIMCFATKHKNICKHLSVIAFVYPLCIQCFYMLYSVKTKSFVCSCFYFMATYILDCYS